MGDSSIQSTIFSGGQNFADDLPMESTILLVAVAFTIPRLGCINAPFIFAPNTSAGLSVALQLISVAFRSVQNVKSLLHGRFTHKCPSERVFVDDFKHLI